MLLYQTGPDSTTVAMGALGPLCARAHYAELRQSLLRASRVEHSRILREKPSAPNGMG
jgi:hypothetical protein